jgi:xanthine dehydrogenase accessory factor
MPNPQTHNTRPGSIRAVLEATLRTIRADASATLALVLETEGSTYVKAGAMVYFGAGVQQIGWLSGGCLEPELRRRADAVTATGAFDVIDIDTRDDEDLFSGSAIGCRGRLRIVLLPLQRLARGDELIEAWRNGVGALSMRMHDDGRLEWQIGAISKAWRLHRIEQDQGSIAAAGLVTLARPVHLLMLGAGPEAPVLMPLLRTLDWFVTAVDRRERWQPNLAYADVALADSPEAVVARLNTRQFDAALVMHHHFELDRSTLQALADTEIPFIGLLGPRRRRDDLFKLLPEPARARLEPRLRSPVGLDLGGLGIDSIALSIAAQLHSFVHGR